MVPVLAIVAWLKQKKSRCCARWPVMARHDLSWFLLRMLRCPENVHSTHHPAGWGVAIYLRASWPQHDCKMLQEDVGTRVQSVNAVSQYAKQRKQHDKWWEMMRHDETCVRCFQLRPDKPMRLFRSLYGPVVVDHSSPLSLGAEVLSACWQYLWYISSRCSVFD
jgi:hypothetical protein